MKTVSQLTSQQLTQTANTLAFFSILHPLEDGSLTTHSRLHTRWNFKLAT